MNILTIMKQKGAALLSKICAILEPLCFSVGSKPICHAEDDLCAASVCSKGNRRRYSSAQLMEGMTPENTKALNAEVAWALEGAAVGEEF